MAVTRTQAGAQSATYLATGLAEFETLTTAHWALLPSGKLKDLLSATYLKQNGNIDPDAFVAACATAGFYAITTQYGSGDNNDASFTLSPGPSEEEPTLPAKGSVIATIELNEFGTVVRLVASYSASE